MNHKKDLQIYQETLNWLQSEVESTHDIIKDMIQKFEADNDVDLKELKEQKKIHKDLENRVNREHREIVKLL